MAKVITWLIVIVLLAGAIAGIIFLTDSGTKTPESLNVLCNNEKIQKDSLVDVTNGATFNMVNLDVFNREYEIYIAPSSNFSYRTGENLWSWSAEQDLNSLFEIDKQKNTFSIKVKYNAVEMLQALHSGEITECDSVDFREGEYLQLIVRAGQAVVICKLAINMDTFSAVPVIGVVIDKDKIVL